MALSHEGRRVSRDERSHLVSKWGASAFRSTAIPRGKWQKTKFEQRAGSVAGPVRQRNNGGSRPGLGGRGQAAGASAGHVPRSMEATLRQAACKPTQAGHG